MEENTQSVILLDISVTISTVLTKLPNLKIPHFIPNALLYEYIYINSHNHLTFYAEIFLKWKRCREDYCYDHVIPFAQQEQLIGRDNYQTAKLEPASRCLIIQCHGGGFVAQSAKSHEVGRNIDRLIDGFVDGLTDGFMDGMIDGLNDGSIDGLIDGLNDGSIDGLNDGSIDGLNDGLNDGSIDGLMD